MTPAINCLKKASERRVQFWRYHINQWSRSGLTQNVYCRKNNLKANQLTYWKNKFKRQNLPVEFIQVAQEQIPDAINPQPLEGLRLKLISRLSLLEKHSLLELIYTEYRNCDFNHIP